MSEPRPPRPKALLDAIEAEPAGAFRGPLWRVVTDGYDPLRPSRAGGRWDDGSFDVLYTSTARDGALAESWFHAERGQPIIPSKVRKRLFRLQATLTHPPLPAVMPWLDLQTEASIQIADGECGEERVAREMVHLAPDRFSLQATKNDEAIAKSSSDKVPPL